MPLVFWLIAARPPEAVIADLEALAAAHADVARIEVLGRSGRGIPIVGLRIGDDRLPGVRILGGHHGDELPAQELPLALIRKLLEENDPVLQTLHLLVVPAVNPDGLKAKTRENGNGVDINRNYGYAFRDSEPGAGTFALSEPEPRAIVFDNELHRYGTSLTYHAGAFNIGYPMNYTTADLPSDALFSMYANAYKALVTDPTFWVTRGAKWYVTHGDLNDHSFGFFGGADFTVEISNVKDPADDAPVVAAQIEAARAWLGHSTRTLQVFVHDAATGVALPASVSSTEITAVCDPLRGEAELQVENATSVQVSLPGYDTITVAAAPGTLEVALDASRREGSAVIPFVQLASGVLAFSVVTASEDAWLFRPGENNVPLDCQNDGSKLSCTALSAPRRPGHYALVLSSSAGEALVPNAVYLSSGETLDAASAQQLWRVTRGGAAITSADPIPIAGTDVWLVKDGAQALLSATEEPQLFGVGPTHETKRGCNSAETPVWICLASLLLLRRRRCPQD